MMKNDIFYGCKLGAILYYAEEQAKKMVERPPGGSTYSSPWARFHQDMSKEKVIPKRENEAATSKDIPVCRAKRNQIYDVLGGDDGAYSSKSWCHMD